jgi:hypothetical protein
MAGRRLPEPKTATELYLAAILDELRAQGLRPQSAKAKRETELREPAVARKEE